MDKYNLLCRACLEPGGFVSLETKINNVSLIEQWFDCTNIKTNLELELSLPNTLCKLCSGRLQDSYSFRLLCIQSDCKLQSVLKCVETSVKDDNSINYGAISNMDSCSQNKDKNRTRKKLESANKRIASKKSEVQRKFINKKTSKLCTDRKKNKGVKNQKRDFVTWKIQSADGSASNEAGSHKRSLGIENQPNVKKRKKKKRKKEEETIDKSSKDDISNVTTSEPVKRDKIIQELYYSDNFEFVFKPKQKKKRRISSYMCETCGHRANDAYSLRVHSRYHTGERPHACPHCSKRFAVRVALTAHLSRHTGMVGNICEMCGHQFASGALLKAHQRSAHAGLRPHACTQCPRAFSQRSNLTAHLRIHEGIKPHRCQVCGKCFRTSSELRGHGLSHSGERPHQCPQCPKRFSLRCNLTAHLRIHRGVRDFKCAECGNTFICKASLKSHLRVHSGVRGHACDVCGARFTHPNTLRAHSIVHTGSRDHACSQCDKKFARASSLNSHKKKHKVIEKTKETIIENFKISDNPEVRKQDNTTLKERSLHVDNPEARKEDNTNLNEKSFHVDKNITKISEKLENYNQTNVEFKTNKSVINITQNNKPNDGLSSEIKKRVSSQMNESSKDIYKTDLEQSSILNSSNNISNVLVSNTQKILANSSNTNAAIHEITSKTSRKGTKTLEQSEIFIGENKLKNIVISENMCSLRLAANNTSASLAIFQPVIAQIQPMINLQSTRLHPILTNVQTNQTGVANIQTNFVNIQPNLTGLQSSIQGSLSNIQPQQFANIRTGVANIQPNIVAHLQPFSATLRKVATTAYNSISTPLQAIAVPIQSVLTNNFQPICNQIQSVNVRSKLQNPCDEVSKKKSN